MDPTAERRRALGLSSSLSSSPCAGVTHWFVVGVWFGFTAIKAIDDKLARLNAAAAAAAAASSPTASSAAANTTFAVPQTLVTVTPPPVGGPGIINSALLPAAAPNLTSATTEPDHTNSVHVAVMPSTS